MVLLTVTPAAAAAFQRCQTSSDWPRQQRLEGEPDISDAEVGKPVSHRQLVAVAQHLRQPRSVGQELDIVDRDLSNLDVLLRGSRIYVEPPPPGKEQTPEFKALMARLRREEEARQYERMISASRHEYLPGSKAEAQARLASTTDGYDEMSYSDVNRQVTLIINVLVSVVACGIAIWLIASHLNAPARLALSFGGSILVGVAEVAVYWGYLQRLQNAKHQERVVRETKQVSTSWVIQGRPLGKGIAEANPTPREDTQNQLDDVSAGKSAVSAREQQGNIRRRKGDPTARPP